MTFVLLLAAIAGGCGTNKFAQEVVTEKAAIQLAEETERGGYELISTDELAALVKNGKDDIVIVDSMPADSYRQGHIPGAVHFEFPKEAMGELDQDALDEAARERYEKLLGDDKDRLIVVYCGYVLCGRSHNGAVWARELGYQNVKRHPGGIFAWRGAGQPVSTP